SGGKSRARGYQPKDRTVLVSLLLLIERQALHASAISFDHPASGERVTFTAPMPLDFRAVLERLRSPHD
ncbi:MAG: RNA pseudouridine synthase, partial [Fidelibacterota bacterium]